MRWTSFVVSIAVLSVGSGVPAAVDRAPGYVNRSLLVETSWAAAHLNDPAVRIVDMRGAALYAAGHVPGAVRIEEGPLRSPEDRFTYLPRPSVFAAMMERAGIGNRTRVIAYDDQGGKMAARLWYVLNAYGDANASLLNGGWQKWTSEGRPTTTVAPRVARARFRPRSIPVLSCPSTELLARRPGTVVLDARSPEEYSGAALSPGAKRAGHIPGAVNVEWKENVAGPLLVFKSADALRRLYAAKGITPDRKIVVHCASGGRAAQTLFTLKLLGYPKVRIYYGSFDDYSARPGVPIDR